MSLFHMTFILMKNSIIWNIYIYIASHVELNIIKKYEDLITIFFSFSKRILFKSKFITEIYNYSVLKLICISVCANYCNINHMVDLFIIKHATLIQHICLWMIYCYNEYALEMSRMRFKINQAKVFISFIFIFNIYYIHFTIKISNFQISYKISILWNLAIIFHWT